MNKKTKSHLQTITILIFFLALMFIWGRLGSLELNAITIRQAVISCLIGLVFMAVSAITYTYLVKED